jgi:phosphohistidine phosphatase SixA
MRFALVVASCLCARADAQDAGATRAIDAARAGGVVIACRHGITNQRDPENELTLKYDDPATQRQLSEEGERQSAALGQAFRTLGIPIAEVVTSPMQRSRRMAELMFGRTTLDSLWHTRGDQYGVRREARQQVLATPVANGNRIIISHIGTLLSVIRLAGSMQEGDCAVLRPAGSGYDLIGTVPWRAWLAAANARQSHEPATSSPRPEPGR